MRGTRIAAAIAAALLVPALVAPAADAHGGKRHSVRAKKTRVASAARTDNRSKPIVYLHGLDAFGTAGVDCNMWTNMRNALTGWGHTGTAATTMYYEGDTNCAYSMDHHGSHATHYGGAGEHNSAGTSHNADTQIEHLGYHLAWMIYDHWSKNGQAVDVVGHSMGGLIARYAIAATQRGTTGFPPYVNVEDVVTYGTPHQGSGWGAWCGWSDQCLEINNGSAFQNWLATNALNPQGSGGTDWTTVGSYDDTFVSEGSAVGMDATHKVKYLGTMNLDHSDYYNDTSGVSDADVEWFDQPGPWYSWYDAPHAVRWADYALAYGSW